jgi:hypothetical protein
MTAPLDAETKRLRSMTPGQIADEVGALKASLATVDEQIETLKLEFQRRKLLEASGALFDITMSPPGERAMLDRAALVADFGEEAVKRRWTKMTTGTSWTLRCFARKQRAKAAIAA